MVRFTSLSKPVQGFIYLVTVVGFLASSTCSAQVFQSFFLTFPQIQFSNIAGAAAFKSSSSAANNDILIVGYPGEGNGAGCIIAYDTETGAPLFTPTSNPAPVQKDGIPGSGENFGAQIKKAGDNNVLLSAPDGLNPRVALFNVMDIVNNGQQSTPLQVYQKQTTGNSEFGTSLAYLGVINGLSHYAISDPRVGEVYIFTEASPTPIRTLTITNGSALEFGQDIESADLNNDGISDLAVGVPQLLDTNNSPRGGVLIYSGADIISSASSIPIQATIRALQPTVDARAGEAIALGDVTGDDKADLVIGSPGFTDPNLSGNEHGGFFVAQNTGSTNQFAFSSDDFRQGKVDNGRLGQDVEITGDPYIYVDPNPANNVDAAGLLSLIHI